MLSLLKRKSKKPGLSPGTLVHVGEKKVEQIKIRVIDYDETYIKEIELNHIEDCFVYKDKPSVSWINIDGLHDVNIIEKIGNRFVLHPLVLEDVVHTGQRPKMEDYEDYLFVIVKMLFFEEEENRINTEQFSLVIGSNYLITFQEMEGDVFHTVRERLRKQKGRIRKMGADYLAYALIDAIVDHYFVVLEKIGERIEALEEEMTEYPGHNTLQMIHHLKRELIFLRKSVWPLREVIGRFERDEMSLIQEKTTVFFRDVYDHTIQVMDSIDTFRDMVSGMLDLYLSTVSNRMNEVMKVLTIIATIFIPMTFIAGIYGMNFELMPELKWPWGYPLVWSVMVVIGIIMLYYFKRKKWL
ncbi:MAG: magnesium/cobalt transporter CorA [Thermodesulfobacteriota bacterium]|nr:magnesium/cobalt transporter CorA [Thermodesulfobacteriota bacterium]